MFLVSWDAIQAMIEPEGTPGYKFFVEQLQAATPTQEDDGLVLEHFLEHGSLRFDRAWVQARLSRRAAGKADRVADRDRAPSIRSPTLQGTVKQRDGRCFSLHDGTGEIRVRLPQPRPGVDAERAVAGAYCLVAGKVVADQDGQLGLRAHKVRALPATRW